METTLNFDPGLRNPIYASALSLHEIDNIAKHAPLILIDVRYGPTRCVYHSESLFDSGGAKIFIVSTDLSGIKHYAGYKFLNAIGVISWPERWNDANFVILDTPENRLELIEWLKVNHFTGWNNKLLIDEIQQMTNS